MPATNVRRSIYWITSSARASTAGGIVSPSALAVLRLMMSSNWWAARWGVARLGAFQDEVHVGGGPAIQHPKVGAVTDAESEAEPDRRLGRGATASTPLTDLVAPWR